jgi:hypothetical protein
MNARIFKPLSAFVAAGILSMAADTKAALITSSANLPPDGVYLDAGIHQTYGGAALEFLLSLPAHRPIADQAMRRAGGAGAPGTPADEVEQFESTLDGLVDVLQFGVSLTGGPQPVSGAGPVQTIVFGKIGNTTGTFDTEIISMDLSGISALGPFMIRESPTLQSLGQTTITDIGGGQFRIDSFFDVFTELSIDGGATWMPSTSPAGHMVLVPEPSSVCFLAVALTCILGFGRRRH